LNALRPTVVWPVRGWLPIFGKKEGLGKNLLIPGGFSFMIFYEIMRKEVILVYRSLWFTPLKS
jgi:hypothetical protein